MPKDIVKTLKRRPGRQPSISRTKRAQIREMAKTRSYRDIAAFFGISSMTVYRVNTGNYAKKIDDLNEDRHYLDGTMGDIVVINDDSEDDAGAVGAGEPEGSGSGNESFEANEGAKDDKSQVQQDQPRRSGRPRKPIQFDSNSDHEESEQRVVIPPPRRPIVKAKNPTTSRPQSGNAGNMNAHAASSSQSRVPASSASTSGGASTAASDMDPAVQEFFKGLGLKGLHHQFPILCKFGFRTTEDLDFHCMSVKDEGDEHLAELEGRLSAKGINGTEWMAISKGLKRRALSMN